MDTIYVTKKAVHVMWEQSRDCPTETGGALVGTLITPLVLAAGGPGSAALKSASSFSTDPEHDRHFLESIRTESQRQVHILGWWHKHPQGMTKPSSGDLYQARKLQKALVDSGKSSIWMLAFILQSAKNPQAAVFPYMLSDLGTEFQSLAIEVVNDDDSIVQRAVGEEKLLLRVEKNTHPWVDPLFRFQTTLVGRRRLEEEKLALENFLVTKLKSASGPRISEFPSY